MDLRQLYEKNIQRESYKKLIQLGCKNFTYDFYKNKNKIVLVPYYYNVRYISKNSYINTYKIDKKIQTKLYKAGKDLKPCKNRNKLFVIEYKFTRNGINYYNVHMTKANEKSTVKTYRSRKGSINAVALRLNETDITRWVTFDEAIIAIINQIEYNTLDRNYIHYKEQIDLTNALLNNLQLILDEYEKLYLIKRVYSDEMQLHFRKKLQLSDHYDALYTIGLFD
jgi:hypothetical protein